MSNIEKRSGRRLTSGEIKILEEIFATGLDFKLVRVHKDYSPTLTKKERKDTEGSSHAIGNDIYLVGDDWSNDLSKSNNIEKQGTLVHEMTHVWQYQNHITIGGVTSSDVHNRERADYYLGALLSIEKFFEFMIKGLQKKNFMTEDQALNFTKKRYPDDVTDHQEYNKKIDYHLSQIEKDKKAYAAEEKWDPICEGGPQLGLAINEYRQPWTLPQAKQKPPLLGLNIQPVPGERLSDFIWKSPLIQRWYGTKKGLKMHMERVAKETGSKSHDAPTDYNYMLQPPGEAHFLWLRTEAQARMVEHYFYIIRGHDPRVVSPTGDYRQPPKLAFYQMMIPFLPGNYK